ncbi:hypothetical protein EGP91_00280 [bacterium]|nr:hypothetical protein [bacterium]
MCTLFRIQRSVETDIKWTGIFEILYYCGLRRGELRGLQWKDINLKIER